MFIKNIDKESILNPLKIIVGIVDKKQTLPILSNILMEKEANQIRFTATDLEIQITTSITVENDGGEQESITIGGKKMQEIIRALPEKSKLSINHKDSKDAAKKIEIKANKSKFSLQTLPAGDFPKLKSYLENAQSIELKQSQLKNLLLSVQYSMAQNDVRYYLNGLLLIIEDGQLKAIATDGHRLAFNMMAIEGNHTKQDIIIPRKAITELCKLLGDSEEPIQLTFSDKQLKAEFSGITLISKVIEGKFPDYKRVIPNHSKFFNINKDEFKQGLQRAAILSNDQFKEIRLNLSEKMLKISSHNKDQEEAQEELEINYEGVEIEIGLNVSYLLEGLNNINSDNIKIYFDTPNSSLLIKSSTQQDFCYVVMPTKI
jgi:DNA polymerase-3 subunit beta